MRRLMREICLPGSFRRYALVQILLRDSRMPEISTGHMTARKDGKLVKFTGKYPVGNSR